MVPANSTSTPLKKTDSTKRLLNDNLSPNTPTMESNKQKDENKNDDKEEIPAEIDLTQTAFNDLQRSINDN